MSKQLILNKSTAIKLYPNAEPALKTIFNETFGEATFTGKITDRILTVRDACEDQGLDYDLWIGSIQDPYKKAEAEIEVFAKALRQGKPANECFYYPWFDRSGGGFSYHDFAYAYSNSNVGARLRVDTPDKARHLGKCMSESYKIYLTCE